jgi:hypothetical protein
MAGYGGLVDEVGEWVTTMYHYTQGV